MLWGRLDGAERIISALLPATKDREIRDQLIKEAHMSILQNENKPNGLIEPTRRPDTAEELWKYYKKDFQVRRKLPLEVKIELDSRGANVTGNMFVGLSETHHFGLGKGIGRLAAWLGAVARSINSLVFKIVAVVRGIFS